MIFGALFLSMSLFLIIIITIFNKKSNNNKTVSPNIEKIEMPINSKILNFIFKYAEAQSSKNPEEALALWNKKYINSLNKIELQYLQSKVIDQQFDYRSIKKQYYERHLSIKYKEISNKFKLYSEIAQRIGEQFKLYMIIFSTILKDDLMKDEPKLLIIIDNNEVSRVSFLPTVELLEMISNDSNIIQGSDIIKNKDLKAEYNRIIEEVQDLPLFDLNVLDQN